MEGNVELRIFDTLGKLVWSLTSRDLIRANLNLNDLKNGMYLLDVRSANKVAIKRFILQR